MTKTLLHFSVAALLALSTAAGAQDAASDEDAETAETPSAPAAGLDTGREVAEENQAYIKETNGDWSLRCFPDEEGEDLCQMYQLLTESEGNPVAEFTLYRIAGTRNIVAGATIAVPLGTLLTEEMKLSVDDAKAKSYAFSYCTMGGCFSRIGLTEPEVEAMKRGAVAQIEIVPAQAPEQKVRIDVSLSGFTATYDATSKLAN